MGGVCVGRRCTGRFLATVTIAITEGIGVRAVRTAGRREGMFERE